MTLYRKVKDIPGSGSQDLGTKEDWTSLLDSMNLSFDYMVAERWLIPFDKETIEDRISRLERLVGELIKDNV